MLTEGMSTELAIVGLNPPPSGNPPLVYRRRKAAEGRELNGVMVCAFPPLRGCSEGFLGFLRLFIAGLGTGQPEHVTG